MGTTENPKPFSLQSIFVPSVSSSPSKLIGIVIIISVAFIRINKMAPTVRLKILVAVFFALKTYGNQRFLVQQRECYSNFCLAMPKSFVKGGAFVVLKFFDFLWWFCCVSYFCLSILHTVCLKPIPDFRQQKHCKIQ